jgi:hypothetical protein
LPIWKAYREKLREFVYRTGVGMRAVFSAAKRGRNAHRLS